MISPGAVFVAVGQGTDRAVQYQGINNPQPTPTVTSQTLLYHHLREIKRNLTLSSGGGNQSVVHMHCIVGTATKPPPILQPSATHHISGCLIHFCRGNEREAVCTVGWGVLLLSWRPLSNAIKIRTGAQCSWPAR